MRWMWRHVEVLSRCLDCHWFQRLEIGEREPVAVCRNPDCRRPEYFDPEPQEPPSLETPVD